MKKAAVIAPFDDLTEGVHREPGDAFLVEDERGEYLKGLGLVCLEDAPKEKPKSKAKKKAK